jgi:hypothetical protein
VPAAGVNGLAPVIGSPPEIMAFSKFVDRKTGSHRGRDHGRRNFRTIVLPNLIQVVVEYPFLTWTIRIR